MMAYLMNTAPIMWSPQADGTDRVASSVYRCGAKHWLELCGVNTPQAPGRQCVHIASFTSPTTIFVTILPSPTTARPLFLRWSFTPGTLAS
jgi:hypothetical protein